MYSKFEDIPTGLKVTVSPTEEPLTPDEVKSQIKIDHTLEDSLITIEIQAAREYVENKLGVALVTQTIEEKLHEFPLKDRLNPMRGIFLKRYPLVTVSSIAYKDSDGNSQTIDSDDYTLVTSSKPPIIAPKNGVSWPTTLEEVGSITVTYTAGYGAASAVPADIKQAMLLIISNWFDNRSNSVQEKWTAADNILMKRRAIF